MTLKQMITQSLLSLLALQVGCQADDSPDMAQNGEPSVVNRSENSGYGEETIGFRSGGAKTVGEN